MFLLAHCFRIIIKSKNLKLNHHKSGTACILNLNIYFEIDVYYLLHTKTQEEKKKESKREGGTKEPSLVPREERLEMLKDSVNESKNSVNETKVWTWHKY